MNDPRSITFTRMDSPSDDDDLFPQLFVFGVTKVSYCEHGNFYSAKGSSYVRCFDDLEGGLVNFGVVKLVFLFFPLVLMDQLILGLLNLLNEIGYHTEGVWERVSEENFVLVVLERVVPSKLKVNSLPRCVLITCRCRTLFRHELADAVLDVLTTESPSGTLVLCLLQAQDLHWHTLLIKGIAFGHVDDIDAYSSPSTPIAHSKIEPLKVSRRVGVWSQEDVVAIRFVTFDDHV